MTQLPIFISLDRADVTSFLGLVASLKKTNPNQTFEINVLHGGLSSQICDKINGLNDDHLHLLLMNVREGLTQLNDPKLLSLYYEHSFNYGLFIPYLFTHVDQGVYLDSKLLINGDISELIKYHQGDFLFQGVHDQEVNQYEEIKEYIEYALGISSDLFIDHHVLIINFAKLRTMDYFAQLLKLEEEFEFLNNEEDKLNLLSEGKIILLEDTYNEKKLSSSGKIINYDLRLIDAKDLKYFVQLVNNLIEDVNLNKQLLNEFNLLAKKRNIKYFEQYKSKALQEAYSDENYYVLKTKQNTILYTFIKKVKVFMQNQ